MAEPIHPENAGTAILENAKRKIRIYKQYYAARIELRKQPCSCESEKCDRCAKIEWHESEMMKLLS